MRPRKCKQNKRYRTSARMTLAYNKSTFGHGTDGQTDRQSATQYAAPSYGGGPHNNNKQQPKKLPVPRLASGCLGFNSIDAPVKKRLTRPHEWRIVDTRAIETFALVWPAPCTHFRQSMHLVLLLYTRFLWTLGCYGMHVRGGGGGVAWQGPDIESSLRPTQLNLHKSSRARHITRVAVYNTSTASWLDVFRSFSEQ